MKARLHSLSLNQLSVVLIRRLHVGLLILNADLMLANIKKAFGLQL